MRRTVALGLVVLSLVVAACGGGKKTVHLSSPDTTTSPTDSAASTTLATSPANPSGGGAASGGGTTTTAAAHGATTTAKAPATTAPAAPAAKIGVAPGHYTYDQTGSRTGGTPPTTAPINTKETLTVDPVSGSDQHTTLTPQGGTTPQEEEVFRYTSSAILFVDLKVNQLGKEFKPSPPVQATPLPPQVGQKWSWDMTSTDNSTTVHGDFSYTGNDTVTVGGQQVPCLVLTAALTFHLSYNGAPITVTDNQTEWVATGLNELQVKIHDVLNAGTFGSSDTTSLMESTQPS